MGFLRHICRIHLCIVLMMYFRHRICMQKQYKYYWYQILCQKNLYILYIHYRPHHLSQQDNLCNPCLYQHNRFGYIHIGLSGIVLYMCISKRNCVPSPWFRLFPCVADIVCNLLMCWMCRCMCLCRKPGKNN